MNKVLLVDDNPMVLALLERTLSSMAMVTALPAADAALAHATKDPPDLVITDYQLGGMNGCELMQRLKAHPATARVPVIISADREDISERLRPVQDSVEDFLEKPFFVREASARIKRVLDKIALEKMAREAPGETRLRGSLAQMNVIDLLQSLELGRKTCALTLTNDHGERCELFFTDGQINHAVYGELRGDEAVFKALTWMEPAGTFQIDFAATSNEQTTTRSTQGLLMEGLRLLDEANRDAAEE
jgi:DNA-binding response OmpR family regulator